MLKVNFYFLPEIVARSGEDDSVNGNRFSSDVECDVRCLGIEKKPAETFGQPMTMLHSKLP